MTFEKERIKEENAYIASAVAKAEVDVELFLQGKPCSLEIDKGLGPRLVESMAVNVMERDADEREKTRATRRAQLEAAGKTKGGNVSFPVPSRNAVPFPADAPLPASRLAAFFTSTQRRIRGRTF